MGKHSWVSGHWLGVLLDTECVIRTIFSLDLSLLGLRIQCAIMLGWTVCEWLNRTVKWVDGVWEGMIDKVGWFSVENTQLCWEHLVTQVGGFGMGNVRLSC